MGGPTTALRDQNAEDLLLTGFNVMQRRANGEKIVVAQNMFEPTELNGPVVRPPTEQGDGDQDGLKIVLTGTPAAKAGKIEVAKGKKAKWAVQVGEFRSKSDAHHQIALVEKKFGQHVADGRGQADKVGRRYKAMFVGLSESDAKDACRAMKSKRLACMVVGPA